MLTDDYRVKFGRNWWGRCIWGKSRGNRQGTYCLLEISTRINWSSQWRRPSRRHYPLQFDAQIERRDLYEISALNLKGVIGLDSPPSTIRDFLSLPLMFVVLYGRACNGSQYDKR